MSIHDEEVLGKAYDARLMRRLLGYLWPYKRQVAVALASIICASVLQLAQPYLMKIAIDRHIAAGDLRGLDRIALAFLAILLASFALEYIQTWTLQMTGQRIMFDIRMQIYRHLQRLDLQFYDRNPVGRLMTRVTTRRRRPERSLHRRRGVHLRRRLHARGHHDRARGRWTGGSRCSPSRSCRSSCWSRSGSGATCRESYRTVRIWIARINAFLQEHITGMPTVQLFRRERQSFARFDEINRTHRDANVDSIFYYAVFYPAIEIIGALAAALLIWFGGGWTLQGTLTLGSLVAFLLYSQRFFRPISDMSEKFNVLQAAMASSERIFKLLDTERDRSGPGLGLGLGSERGPGSGLGTRGSVGARRARM